nr:ATP-binding protein [Metallosphaera tengchongensis]
MVSGLRRTGKSSVVMISIGELKFPYIYIDLRRFEEKSYFSYKDFLIEIEREVNKLVKRFPSLLDFLKGVKGLNVMGNEVKFNWGRKERLSFSFLLEALNDWTRDVVVVVMDEAQELINLRGVNLLYPLAYSFDNLSKVKIILSGSKMGLLYRFLRADDANSPLFGRAMNEVELHPFNRVESVNFLRKGFEELGIEFKDHERVYEEVGGIPGWLTYFGYYYYRTRDFNDAIKRTTDKARDLTVNEFNNFLLKRTIAKDRYMTVMRTIARECSRWSEIKSALEVNEGRELSDSEIYNYLNRLMDSSWIVKRGDLYCPAEKLISKVFRELI